ncbi:MAG: hypothetical protein RJA81_2248 [Planctomycetota bacterium]|jgi:4-amino-4-deoxy-L-arabinose transferase-like glycosyltransferase
MNDTSVTDVSLYAASPVSRKDLIILLSGLILGSTLLLNRVHEAHFVDESAYISQAYFGDLFITGQYHSSLWFEYPAYDLPPFTKYLVWAGFVFNGDPRPGPAAMRAWYQDTSKRFVSDDVLQHARLPVTLCGVVCVIATGFLANRWKGIWAGLLAMSMLVVNPLFRTHSRRAMADIPTEMGVVLALLILSSTHQGWRKLLRSAFTGGVFLGLAASSKLNGLLASMVIAGWALLSLRRNPSDFMKTIIAGILGAAFFIFLNPFFYASSEGLGEPQFREIREMSLGQRLRFVMDHRISVSKEGQNLFPNDALRTIPEKLSVMVIQGFGRFSPLGPRHDDSRNRFDIRQDWACPIWLITVLSGALFALRDSSPNRKSGQFLVLYGVIAVIVVGAFLPLAWNRYFLPIVIPSTILAAGSIVSILQKMHNPKSDRISV